MVMTTPQPAAHWAALSFQTAPSRSSASALLRVRLSDLDRVARLHQIADHPLSHDAGADKSNGLHVCTPLFCLRCIQHITLFPPRQGGGPILPGRLERGSEDFRPLRGGGFPAIIQISYGYGRFQIFLFRMQ